MITYIKNMIWCFSVMFHDPTNFPSMKPDGSPFTRYGLLCGQLLFITSVLNNVNTQQRWDQHRDSNPTNHQEVTARAVLHVCDLIQIFYDWKATLDDQFIPTIHPNYPGRTDICVINYYISHDTLEKRLKDWRTLASQILEQPADIHANYSHKERINLLRTHQPFLLEPTPKNPDPNPKGGPKERRRTKRQKRDDNDETKSEKSKSEKTYHKVSIPLIKRVENCDGNQAYNYLKQSKLVMEA